MSSFLLEAHKRSTGRKPLTHPSASSAPASLISWRNSAWFSLMSRNKAGFCLPNSWSIGCCVPFIKHPKGIPKFRVYSRRQWRKEWWYPFVHHTLHPFARDAKRPPHVCYQYIKQRWTKSQKPGMQTWSICGFACTIVRKAWNYTKKAKLCKQY